MKQIFLTLSSLIAAQFSFAADVSLRNNSDGTLKCEINQNGKYIPFARVMPLEKKEFSEFKLNSAIRCVTQLDERSTTIFTYYTISKAGEYESLKELVACSDCTDASSNRYATVIVPPNGQAHYTEYRQPIERKLSSNNKSNITITPVASQKGAIPSRQ